MSGKHTPGPWTIDEDGWCPQADLFENQPLCRAAPDMLAALKRVQEYANFILNGVDRIAVKKIVEPAIAAAEGTTDGR